MGQQHLETANLALSQLEGISMPRFRLSEPMSPIQIHAISEESMRTYGFIVYICTRYPKVVQVFNLIFIWVHEGL